MPDYQKDTIFIPLTVRVKQVADGVWGAWACWGHDAIHVPTAYSKDRATALRKLERSMRAYFRRLYRETFSR